MNTNLLPRRRLSRRVFLRLAAATGMTAALGDALCVAAPWLDYNEQARRTWDTPFQKSAHLPAQMRELIRYATLAPSGHNAQPWKFSVQANTIHIAPDYSRRLPVVDPDDRELWISLGCCVENLMIAAQYAGYETDLALPAPGADDLTLQLRPSPIHRSPLLFQAIPHRQNTRSLYDGASVPRADLTKLEGLTTSSGVSLSIITAPAQKEAILEYVKAGDQRQYGDPAFTHELVSWLRFNKPEALHALDGLYARCSGNPDLPRWLGERFVTSGGGRQSDTDVKNVRSSSGLLVIAAAKDDRHHWIETGRLYERLALTLTALNVKTAFLNQPVEVPDLRSQLRASLSLDTAQPQLLLRFGYAPPMPRSLRRPVGQVLV